MVLARKAAGCFYCILLAMVFGTSNVMATQLKPCPETPNCVSSLATSDQHAINPLTYTTDAPTAKQHLLAVINELPRTKIITQKDDYIHATFTSLIFRFVDDVEFVLDDANKTIHVRSASRVGKSDLGVNRKRVEAIRLLFNGKNE
jgi:uncharacterized protein (DUF1499 family)